jgi:Uma2 family endonuclease
MVTPKPGIKYTYADYLLTPDDVRYELIDGELILAPAPTTPHQRLLFKFGRVLGDLVDEHSLGEVFIAPTDVYLDDANVVQPDLLFVSAARAGIITEANIQGAPDLVVEVASPSKEALDLGVKLELYARFGVSEYWTAQPDDGTVVQRVLQDGRYIVVGTFGVTDTFVTPLFPGLEIQLGRVF